MGVGVCSAMGSAICTAEGRGGIVLGPVAVLPSACAQSSKGSQLVCEASAPPAVALLAAAVGRDVDLVDAGGVGRVRTLKGHAGPVTCLLVAGGMLFSGSLDRTVKRWDTRKMVVDLSMEGHTSAVWCLSFVVDVLYSASEDMTVRRWDAKKGTPLSVWQEHSGPITCMLTHGRYLFTGSQDTTVVRWDLVSLQREASLIGQQGGVACLLVAEDCVFTGAKDGAVRRWRMQTMIEEEPDALMFDRRNCMDPVSCLVATELYIFSGHRSGKICQWGLEGSELVRMFDDADTHEAGVMTFLVRRDLVLSGGADGTVRLWDKVSGELYNILEGASGVMCLVETCGGTIFGGQARGGPQRLPPLCDKSRSGPDSERKRPRRVIIRPAKNGGVPLSAGEAEDVAAQEAKRVMLLPVNSSWQSQSDDDVAPSLRRPDEEGSPIGDFDDTARYC